MRKKEPKPITEKMVSNRNPIAYSLINFKSAKFKHKNEKRGGGKNKFKEILEKELD